MSAEGLLLLQLVVVPRSLCFSSSAVVEEVLLPAMHCSRCQWYGGDRLSYIYFMRLLFCCVFVVVITVLAIIICRLKSHYNQLIESLYNTNDGKQQPVRNTKQCLLLMLLLLVLCLWCVIWPFLLLLFVISIVVVLYNIYGGSFALLTSWECMMGRCSVRTC